MNRRTAVRKLVAASAGSFFAGLIPARLSAQSLRSGRLAEGQPADQPDAEIGSFTLRSQVRLVLLDVCVKDRSGAFITDLPRESFRVLENGRPQTISVFDQADVPVTVGILVDESRSMTPKRQEVLTAAQTLIEESNREDEIFVLNFNDTVAPGLPRNQLFSDDIQELRAALHSGRPTGKTALYDAVVDGLKQLELGRRDKKTLVLISDGGDNASEHRRRDTVNMVERSVATIYTVGLFDTDDPDRDPGVLRELARISGGEAFFPASPAEMVPVCRGIAKEIRTRYTVGYRPQEDNGKASLRRVQVRVAAPGHGRITVRTRSSYFYDEAEVQKQK
jgi:Ca-activated chloride channel family protein